MTKLGAGYSLSEIEAHAKKAVRGAGFSWGHAEEAAKSVRFLAAHQLPGAAALAAYLQGRAASGTYSRPVMSASVWSVVEGVTALCPLLSGGCLCDNAQVLMRSENGLVLEKLSYPLLVVPYLALMSRQGGVSLRVCWAGVELTCHEGRVERLICSDDALAVARTERFECEVIAVDTVAGVEAGNLGQVISDAVWLGLNEFACCTYVAATEASRRGAGPAD